jgi:hypothetical protein
MYIQKLFIVWCFLGPSGHVVHSTIKEEYAEMYNFNLIND